MMNYVCDKTPTVKTDNVRIGVIQRPIPANTYQSFDEAVEKGDIIVLNGIVEDVDLPVESDTETVIHDKMIKFFTILRRIYVKEINNDTQGFSLKGNIIGRRSRNNIISCFKESIVDWEQKTLANTFHYEKIYPKLLENNQLVNDTFGIYTDKYFPGLVMQILDKTSIGIFETHNFTAKSPLNPENEKTFTEWHTDFMPYLSSGKFLKCIFNKNVQSFWETLIEDFLNNYEGKERSYKRIELSLDKITEEE